MNYTGLFKLCLFVSTLALSCSLQGQSGKYTVATEPQMVPNQLIVSYDTPQDPKVIMRLIEKSEELRKLNVGLLGATSSGRNFLIAIDTPDKCTGVRRALRSDGVEPNYIMVNNHDVGDPVPATGTFPQVPLLSPLQNCGGEVGHVRTALDAGEDEVKVVVIDSRINPENHTQLFGNTIVQQFDTPIPPRTTPRGYENDPYNHDVVAEYEDSDDDPYFTAGLPHADHGTAVAGIIAHSFHAAGAIDKLKMMVIPVLNGAGEGTTYALLNALDLADTAGADIVNLSLGFDATKETCGGVSSDALLDKLLEGKYLVVASAGNGEPDTENPGSFLPGQSLDYMDRFPTTYDYNKIITVGSVNCTGTNRSYFSNYSAEIVDLLAPGEGITVPDPDVNDYVLKSGTSYSAPVVTGVLAKLVSRYGRDVALQKIRDAAMPVSSVSEDGRGVINTCYMQSPQYGCEDKPADEVGEGEVTHPYTGASEQAGGMAIGFSSVVTPATVYPNPANHEVFVNLPEGHTAAVASVIDFSGRELLRQPVTSTSLRFDLSGLPAGQYFVLLRGTTTERPLPVTKR